MLFGGPLHWTIGLVATLTTALCIIGTDTGAYFVGKYIGKTQLIKVSPKKTVEGTLGGLVSSLAMGLLCRQLFSWPVSLYSSLGFSVSIEWQPESRNLTIITDHSLSATSCAVFVHLNKPLVKLKTGQGNLPHPTCEGISGTTVVHGINYNYVEALLDPLTQGLEQGQVY